MLSKIVVDDKCEKSLSRHTFFRTSKYPNTTFDFLSFAVQCHTSSENISNLLILNSIRHSFIHRGLNSIAAGDKINSAIHFGICEVPLWDRENREEWKTKKIVARIFPVTFLHICKILRQPPPCLFFFRLIRLVLVSACERKRRMQWLSEPQTTT